MRIVCSFTVDLKYKKECKPRVQTMLCERVVEQLMYFIRKTFEKTLILAILANSGTYPNCSLFLFWLIVKFKYLVYTCSLFCGDLIALFLKSTFLEDVYFGLSTSYVFTSMEKCVY